MDFILNKLGQFFMDGLQQWAASYPEQDLQNVTEADLARVAALENSLFHDTYHASIATVKDQVYNSESRRVRRWHAQR